MEKTHVLKQMMTKTLGLVFCFGCMSAEAKNINLTSNPVGLLINQANLGVDYGINNKISLGVHGAFIFGFKADEPKGIKASGMEVGLRAHYHASSFEEDGYYGTVGASLSSVELSNSLGEKEDLIAYHPRLLGGYQWVWDSGANLKLGAGFVQAHNSKTKAFNRSPVEIKRSVTLPAVELEFGFLI